MPSEYQQIKRSFENKFQARFGIFPEDAYPLAVMERFLEKGYI